MTSHQLKRVLQLHDLVSFGVGGTIGAGIFVSIGVGAAQAGPALILSFLLAAVACSLSASCFCEMASRVPTSGSSYSYVLAVLGDFPAFVIGSVLVLDSVISAAACARAWTAYVRVVFPFLPSFLLHNVPIPGMAHVASFSLLSGLVCAGLGVVLAFGITGTRNFNNFSTILNSLVLAVFVVAGISMTDASNWTPFAPNGAEGVVRGAGRIFFAFLGFDVVNCLAEESEASGLVPRAIQYTIGLSALAYFLVAAAFTGLAPIGSISLASPLASAFEYRQQSALAFLVSVGAVGNTLTSVLSNFLVQPRIVLRMAADGFLPAPLGVIEENGVPKAALFVTVAASTFTAMFVEFETLADMVSVASLVSLSMVCVCCVIVRLAEPAVSPGVGAFKQKIYLYILAVALLCACVGFEGPAWMSLLLLAAVATLLGIINSEYRFFSTPAEAAPDTSQFRVPLSPILPLLGVLINTYLLMSLPALALVRAVCVFTICALYYGLRLRSRPHLDISRGSTPDSTLRRRSIVVGKACVSYDAIATQELATTNHDL